MSYITNISSFTSALVAVSILSLLFCLIVFYLVLEKNELITNIPLFLTFIMIITAVIGPAFFAFSVGSFSLFPLRITIILLFTYFILQLLKVKKISFERIYVKNYLFFLLIWMLYSALSLLWALSKEDGIRNVLILFSGISIVFLCVFYVRKIRDLNIIFNIWLWILPMLLLLGIWNVFTGEHLSISGLANAAERHRFVPTAVFVNPNNFATYLSLSVPFVLAFIRHSELKGKYIIGNTLLIFTIYLLLMTGSRANYIALLIGLIFWFVLINSFKSKMKILFTLILSGILFAVLFGSSNSLPVMNFTEGINIEQFSNEAEIQGSSIEIRNNLIKNSLIFLTESFGFGVGSGNIEYYMENKYHFYTYGVLNVHNWWIEVLVNYGIFIFLLYLLFMLAIFMNLLKSVKDKNLSIIEKKISEALLVGFIIFIIASISSSSLIDFGPQWIFWGMTLVLINLNKSKKGLKI